jgi:ABC-type sugar transport system ATPase subunit
MNFLAVSPSDDGLALPGGRSLTLSHPRLADVRTLGVRPEHLELASPETAHFSGTISVIEQFGEYALAYIELPGGELITIKLDGAPDLQLHQTIHVRLPAEGVHLFDQSGRALR